MKMIYNPQVMINALVTEWRSMFDFGRLYGLVMGDGSLVWAGRNKSSLWLNIALDARYIDLVVDVQALYKGQVGGSIPSASTTKDLPRQSFCIVTCLRRMLRWR